MRNISHELRKKAEGLADRLEGIKSETTPVEAAAMIRSLLQLVWRCRACGVEQDSSGPIASSSEPALADWVKFSLAAGETPDGIMHRALVNIASTPVLSMNTASPQEVAQSALKAAGALAKASAAAGDEEFDDELRLRILAYEVALREEIDENGTVNLDRARRQLMSMLRRPKFEQHLTERERFEDAAFAQGFLSSIERTKPSEFGPIGIRWKADGCPTKIEFLSKKEDGEYVDDTLNSAWWAWCEALKDKPMGAERARASFSSDPLLPCDLIVGSGTFTKGLPMRLAQGAINRMFRRMKEDLERQVAWFRDAVSVLGFDAPAGDGVNPLKEKLVELLAVGTTELRDYPELKLILGENGTIAAELRRLLKRLDRAVRVVDAVGQTIDLDGFTALIAHENVRKEIENAYRIYKEGA
jgi:hypothetical protein